MLITVDGITYEVEHTTSALGQPEYIVLWDAEDNFVGDVVLDHNHEHAAAQLNGDDAHNVNYFDMSGKSTEEVAMWIAGVSQ